MSFRPYPVDSPLISSCRSALLRRASTGKHALRAGHRPRPCSTAQQSEAGQAVNSHVVQPAGHLVPGTPGNNPSLSGPSPASVSLSGFKHHPDHSLVISVQDREEVGHAQRDPPPAQSACVHGAASQERPACSVSSRRSASNPTTWLFPPGKNVSLTSLNTFLYLCPAAHRALPSLPFLPRWQLIHVYLCRGM